MEKGWRGLPFRPISEYYKIFFGEKVYKIPVSVAEDCPNRQGLRGMKTCIFCDEWGSAAFAGAAQMPLAEQIQSFKLRIGKRYKAKKFLVYYQAYTNTFLKLSLLRENFEIAKRDPDVVGVVVGTRPDCLSKGVLDLWQETQQTHKVFVEIGVQSFNESVLTYFRRGHTAAAAVQAIERIYELTKLDLGIHLIFGAPGETLEDIAQAARICNGLPITNIKLHHLHVLKNTPLAEEYSSGRFLPLSLEEYSERVQLFLSLLRPDIFIHRLAAFSSRWDELIAPLWTANKMGAHQKIVDDLRATKTFQAKDYVTNDPLLRSQQFQLSKNVDFLDQSKDNNLENGIHIRCH